VRCGIDEAGKGPVLGPLVIAGVRATPLQAKKLQELDVKDSKMLTAKKRDELFVIISKMKHHIIIIPPEEIDAALFSSHLNLNKLESLKTVEILNTLKPKEAFIDCPDINTERYKAIIATKVNCKLTVEHRAEKYEVVAAASILAKVTRDRLMKEYNLDCGSGYASDPKTQLFVKENWEKKKYVHLFRHSWETIKRLKRAKEQKTLL